MEVLDGRVVSVQNRFSPAFRSSLGELQRCAELGIAFLPFMLGLIGVQIGFDTLVSRRQEARKGWRKTTAAAQPV